MAHLLNMKEPAGKLECPVCGSPSFEPTPQVIDLRRVLERWQIEADITLRDSVWREYKEDMKSSIRLYRCSTCRAQMFMPPVSGSEDFYADITAKEYYVAEKWEFYQAARDIERYKRKKVLDIGCGNGYFLSLLSSRVKHIGCVGYEFNSVMADMARGKGHTVYTGRFPEAVLGSDGKAEFDAVCLFQVLEHLSDPMGFLRDVCRAMIPGGLLFVGVPDAEGPLRFFPYALTDIPPHHVTRWSRETFRRGLRGLGLEFVKAAYEPLPHYLWQSYLPPIIEQRFPSLRRADTFIRGRLTSAVISLMKTIGIKWLHGVRGHTLYVVLRFGKD